ncbi:GNAT family N-acetyltransferase [Fictibacillus sp. KIGAM418]|uniref:GNAT family N-acetyltransferase n=1 Tax=Fictibacillus marinisediminis TaxID=2878389 RepID=A0A9X2BE44_9BACL|nr:GNAT family N-acetyltransferase [Fictibacillus marinisediminis]MCK6258579.1 GNAT family N-acetyltransferase [Fictibacillus marinisediminis]
MEMMTGTVKELIGDSEWLKGFTVMKELRTELSQQEYLELMQIMSKEGYRLFALEQEGVAAAVAGIIVRTNFYNKKHVFVYDLVTHPDHRSKGYGEKLLDHVHQWAKEEGCEFASLESGVQRKDAHRFYEDRMGYERYCYSFRKTL